LEAIIIVKPAKTAVFASLHTHYGCREDRQIKLVETKMGNIPKKEQFKK
jgi:hypothetical protein